MTVTDAEESYLRDEIGRLRFELNRLRASHARLLGLVRVLLDNDPDDMAGDAITVLDVWRKEAIHAAIAAAEGGGE